MRVTVNLAEIRIVFVRDMGTSAELLQPCRLFPAEGEAVCVNVFDAQFKEERHKKVRGSLGIYMRE